jgi:hypothetical protein
VKLIGVTAHVAPTDFDEGPIIEQPLARVDQAFSPEQLLSAGRPCRMPGAFYIEDVGAIARIHAEVEARHAWSEKGGLPTPVIRQAEPSPRSR